MADTCADTTEHSADKSTEDQMVSPNKSVVKPRPGRRKLYKARTSQPVTAKKPKQLQQPQSSSPELPKPPKAAKTQNPTMLSMIMEALRNNKSTKGLTLQGLKRYITETYPDVQESFSNVRLKTALLKGLESNEIIRPKSSEETGMKGYFLLNRTLHVQKEKAKKQALKAKLKKPVEQDKQPKKKSNVAKMIASIPRSTSSGKSNPAKSKTLVSKSKVQAEAPEAQAETPEAQGKVSEPSQKKVTKKKTKTPSSSKSRTPKIIATPKMSKSTMSGVRKKSLLSLLDRVSSFRNQNGHAVSTSSDPYGS